MGTNYYAHHNTCACCGRFEERHIGKSSMGWSFSFHIYPEEEITSSAKLLTWLEDPSIKIFDEYHTEIPLSELLEIIDNHKDGLRLAERPYNWLDEQGNRVSDREFC